MSIIQNYEKRKKEVGMKGCYIYCTDKKLAEYFKETLERAE